MPARIETPAGRRSLGVRTLFPLALLALLAPLAAPTAGQAAPAPTAAPAAARLDAWDHGASLLDDGRNAEAAELFARLLRERVGGLEAAEGFYLASTRLGRPDSALAGLNRLVRAAAAPAAAREAFLAGARLRLSCEFGGAAREFARAAALSRQAADTASAAAACLAAAQTWLREEDQAGIEATCARIDTLLAGEPGQSRLGQGRPGQGRLDNGHPAGRRLRGECDLLRAGVQNLNGRADAADSLYQDVLARARAAGWRQLRCDAWNGLGVSFSRRRLSGQAIAHYRRALAEARRLGDPNRLGIMLVNLAYEQTLERELAAAGACLDEARRIAERFGLEPLKGLVASGQGALAEARGERRQAAELFRQACDLHARTRNVRGELASNQWLAYLLLQMGEYRDSAAHYGRCLEILREKPGPHILNWVLAGMAATQHYLGNLDLAERYYRQALAVDEQMGDRRSAALCLNSIGLLNALRGDYRQALLDHHHAREIYAALGDAEGAGKADASIAEVLYHLGDYERAREHGEQAVTVAEQEGAEELLQSASSVMALIYRAAGRSDLAEEHFRRALAISRRWHDNLATIAALDDLADSYLAQGRPEEARPLVTEAAGLLKPQGEYPSRARTLLLLARLAEDPGRAAALAEQALAAAQEGCLPEAEWRSLSDLGQYALARGDTAQAERFLRRALGVIESLRRDVGVDELRRHMLQPALEPYERLVDLLLARSRADSAAASALVVAERSRAQVLAARLRAAYAHGAAATASPGADGDDDRELLSRLAYLQARLQDGTLPGQERRALRERVDELEESFRVAQLRRAGAAGSGELYPEVEPADSLLAALRPGERVLSWFLGERRSYLFAAAAGRVRAYPLPPRPEIESRLLLFFQMQGDQGAAGLPADARDAAARELYELLLGPAAHEVRAARTLVLLPDGLLHRLPFALLHDGPRCLVEERELFVAPSLRTLRDLRSRARARQREAATPRLAMLAVGCEGGAEADTASAADAAGDGAGLARTAGGAAAQATGRVLPFTGAPVPRLREAAAEAAEAASRFPGALVLTGAAADEASFKRAPLADARIVHVAAHGIADPLDVRRSLLVLNPAPAGPRADSPDSTAGALEDGVLQWHEAVALPLRASLVTLSSCQSAGGVLARGEGVTGLTQAFLHAGATCVLAAQSGVPDRSARRLMQDFYRELRAGRTAAAALREAQRRALARPADGEAEAAWAGFLLTGDGSVTIAAPARARPAWLGTGLAWLGLAGLMSWAGIAAWRRRRPAGRP